MNIQDLPMLKIVCAWCGTVKAWTWRGETISERCAALICGDLRADLASVKVSHGICECCRQREFGK